MGTEPTNIPTKVVANIHYPSVRSAEGAHLTGSEERVVDGWACSRCGTLSVHRMGANHFNSFHCTYDERVSELKDAGLVPIGRFDDATWMEDHYNTGFQIRAGGYITESQQSTLRTQFGAVKHGPTHWVSQDLHKALGEWLIAKRDATTKKSLPKYLEDLGFRRAKVFNGASVAGKCFMCHGTSDGKSAVILGDVTYELCLADSQKFMVAMDAMLEKM